MTGAELVRNMMARRKISINKMADMLNYKRRTSFVSRLENKNGLRLDHFVKMADVCDFDVILKDRYSPEQFVLDPGMVGERTKREDEDGYGYVTRTGRSDLGGDEPGV